MMWPLLIFYNSDVATVIVETLAVILIFFLTLSFVKRISNDIHISIQDVSKRHNWNQPQFFHKPCYCSICESLLVSGEWVTCDCCGVCADSSCIKIADKTLKCKALTCVEKGSMKHHWVKGNVPQGAVCSVCDEDCEGEPGLLDWQCCWCQRSVHARCKSKIIESCDFGPFHNLIVPPSSVLVHKRSVRRNLRLRAVKSPSWPNWSPLIVVANRKSGNKNGDLVLSLFRRLLNPAQVVDLAERPPEAALEWCTMFEDIKAKVLVAGGDGTIGWVLNVIDKLKLKMNPTVAILPLGTGNDLSRVLGWGKEHAANIDPSDILDRISRATEVLLDRWMLQVSPVRHLGIKMPSRQIFMYNYFSIGVDAQVALDFHRTRESPFYLFSNRIFNKILYLSYGTQQAVERSCQDLEKRLTLYLDEQSIELPSIESIVILNIPSWGAGVHLWSMGGEGVPHQSFSDGKVEVVALFSSFHIAQLQMGLSQPYRIGQAKQVKIVLKSPTAVQVDGEPWLQPPGEITITYHNQANMLKLNLPDEV